MFDSKQMDNGKKLKRNKFIGYNDQKITKKRTEIPTQWRADNRLSIIVWNNFYLHILHAYKYIYTKMEDI